MRGVLDSRLLAKKNLFGLGETPPPLAKISQKFPVFMIKHL